MRSAGWLRILPVVRQPEVGASHDQVDRSFRICSPDDGALDDQGDDFVRTRDAQSYGGCHPQYRDVPSARLVAAFDILADEPTSAVGYTGRHLR